MKKLTLFLGFLFCLFSYLGYSYTRIKKTPLVITGRVWEDCYGTPLEGVLVSVVGASPNRSTLTDINGNFSITTLSAPATLHFYYIGANTQDIVVTESGSLGEITLNFFWDSCLITTPEAKK